MLKLSSRELFFHKNVQRLGKGLQMMMYSAGSSDSYRVDVTFCVRITLIHYPYRAHACSIGKLLQAAVQTSF